METKQREYNMQHYFWAIPNETLLTKKEFDKFLPGEMIASGELPNLPEGLYMTDSCIGRKLKWVAVKGYNNDWTIYCHWNDHSAEYIVICGTKVTNEHHIRRCVPCKDDVFKLYRY